MPEEPNMDMLGKRVGELAVDDEAINSGLKLLMEKVLLEDLPKEARKAVEDRLKLATGGWRILDKPLKRIADMPGKWTRRNLGGGGRVNKTQELLSAWLVRVSEGDDTAWSLRVTAIRGKLYGEGETIVFTWTGKDWREEIIEMDVS